MIPSRKLTLFIENHLKTYVSEHQGHLEIGNAYGFESGIVSMTEKTIVLNRQIKKKKGIIFLTLKKKIIHFYFPLISIGG